MYKISEIELTPVKAKNGLTFFTSFILNNNFYVGNIAVFTRPDGSGFRCVYPTKTLPNGEQIPIFHPINKQTGQEIEYAIATKANQLLGIE